MSVPPSGSSPKPPRPPGAGAPAATGTDADRRPPAVEAGPEAGTVVAGAPVGGEGARGLSDWLATMSHELRTPLNAIVGYADLMLLGMPHRLPDESRMQVDRMRLAARHLLSLLDEVLTFARVEGGHETVRAAQVTVAQVVREAAAQIEPLAAARELRVAVALPAHPVTLLTDGVKLRQILAHLAGSSCAATSEGTVTIAAREDGEAIVFEVRDTSGGIPPDELAHVFDPFWRLTAGAEASAGRTRGAGLGLTIAQHLTQLLGGEIAVRSRLGIGSTFTVRLPRQARTLAPRDRALRAD